VKTDVLLGGSCYGMGGAMMLRSLALVVVLLATCGCSTMRNVLGLPNAGDPSVAIKPAETRWLLIKNPRFGDVPSEPEYVWVEEDKIPTTFTTLVRGKSAIIASPEVVTRYGMPPGGGKISPRQRMPEQAASATFTPAGAPPPKATAKPPVGPAAAAPPPATNGKTSEGPKRGLVIYVDTTRIVIDLTASDGIRPGTIVSLRRDAIPIVHPVTGEMLGELDEEVATARVTETREKFSIADVQTLATGAKIQVKDRVVPK
jgi:Flagellar assembly protein T, C-terminal domain